MSNRFDFLGIEYWRKLISGLCKTSIFRSLQTENYYKSIDSPSYEIIFSSDSLDIVVFCHCGTQNF